MTMTEKNKPLEELNPDFIKENIKAVTFDLDGVVVPTGTFLRQSVDGSKLTVETHILSDRMVDILKRLKDHVWINFSSGRSLLHLETMVDPILWDNVSLIGENGNFIFMDGKIEQLASYDQSYFQKLVDIKKDLKELKKENPEVVHGFEPKHVILTIHTEKEVPEVKGIVDSHDPEDELYCLWTSEGYDIGHRNTNKKTALDIFSEKLGINPKEMITTGNNLNDREMLEYGIGVSVDPDRVDGQYAIPKNKNRLGGEVLAEYILDVFE